MADAAHIQGIGNNVNTDATSDCKCNCRCLSYKLNLMAWNKKGFSVNMSDN